MIAISDDLRHDSYAVKGFEDKAFDVLRKQNDIKVIHEWTDGCGVQYKAKTAFAIVSSRCDPDVMRNYFETSHGKNVCDGLGAITKNSAHQAVSSGKQIISNAKELFDHCQSKLSHDAKKVDYDVYSVRDFFSFHTLI